MSRQSSTGTSDWLLGAVKQNPEGLLLLAAGACLLLRKTGGKALFAGHASSNRSYSAWFGLSHVLARNVQNKADAAAFPRLCRARRIMPATSPTEPWIRSGRSRRRLRTTLARPAARLANNRRVLRNKLSRHLKAPSAASCRISLSRSRLRASPPVRLSLRHFRLPRSNASTSVRSAIR